MYEGTIYSRQEVQDFVPTFSLILSFLLLSCSVIPGSLPLTTCSSDLVTIPFLYMYSIVRARSLRSFAVSRFLSSLTMSYHDIHAVYSIHVNEAQSHL